MGQGDPGALCAQGALRGQLKLQWIWAAAAPGLFRQKASGGTAEAEMGGIRVSQNAQCSECPGRFIELGQHGLGVPGPEPGESQEVPVISVPGVS